MAAKVALVIGDSEDAELLESCDQMVTESQVLLIKDEASTQ